MAFGLFFSAWKTVLMMFSATSLTVLPSSGEAPWGTMMMTMRMMIMTMARMKTVLMIMAEYTLYYGVLVPPRAMTVAVIGLNGGT